jgi:hypothetical protein
VPSVDQLTDEQLMAIIMAGGGIEKQSKNINRHAPVINGHAPVNTGKVQDTSRPTEESSPGNAAEAFRMSHPPTAG